MSTYTIEHTTTLTTLDCGVGGCGIAFAIPTSLYTRARDDHSVCFYCPNGHHVGFTGKSDRQKAAERAEFYRQQLASREEDVRAERAAHAATKGKLTKARKRADAGVCQHCHRSFQNVSRHVKSQHADVVAAGGVL